MVTMTLRSLSNLHCEAVHDPSGTRLQTDAPVDVGGEASSFSPTDLVGVALLSCIMTTMGLAAGDMGITLTGMTGRVEKIMSHDKPRRIARLKIALSVPLAADHAATAKLTHAAHHCPVHHSLHPDMIQEIAIDWTG